MGTLSKFLIQEGTIVAFFSNMGTPIGAVAPTPEFTIAVQYGGVDLHPSTE